MKLLKDRVNMCDDGKLKMCTAEYSGNYKPWEEPIDKLSIEWLLEELTYDDCTRKEAICAHINDYIQGLIHYKCLYIDLRCSIEKIVNVLDR